MVLFFVAVLVMPARVLLTLGAAAKTLMAVLIEVGRSLDVVVRVAAESESLAGQEALTQGRGLGGRALHARKAGQ